MATIAEVRNEINKVLASAEVPGPFYAAAGVGDLAVEKARAAQSRLQEFRPASRIAELSTEARGLPATVLEAATNARGRAVGVYGGLTTRGKKLVGRVDAQQATKDLEQDTAEVVRAAKTTATTAEKGTASTKASAKRTTTTAKKTATTARKAAGDAASKTGDAKNAPKSGTRSGAQKKTTTQKKSQGTRSQQRDR